MEQVHVGPDELLVRRGDMGDYFYLLESGAVAVYVDKSETFERAEDEEEESELLDLITSHKGGLGRVVPMGQFEDVAGLHLRSSVLPQKIERTQTLRSFKLSVNMGEGGIHVPQRSNTRASGFSIVLREACPFADLGATNTATNTGLNDEVELDLRNDRYIRDLEAGDTFGEVALLYNCPRTAHCITHVPCVLWRIKASVFKRVMAKNLKESVQVCSGQPDCRFCKLGREVLSRVPEFSELGEETLCQVATCMTQATVRKGDVIISKGEIGNTFYVIKEGEVLFHDIGWGDCKNEDLVGGPGQFFGEKALMTGDRRSANVTAISNKVELLVMGRHMFEKNFGHLEDLIERSLHRKKLLSLPSFAKAELAPHEIEDLLDRVQTITFAAGTTIAEPGKWGEQGVAFITKGVIRVTNEKKGLVYTLAEGCCMGTHTLEFTGPAENFKNDSLAVVVEDVRATLLSRESIEAVIGTLTRLGKPPPLVSSKLDDMMTLNDLTMHRILGMGSFGKVWLTQHKRHPERVFALKVMDKMEIHAYGMVDKVIAEKNILASINHPLIVNLVAAFQEGDKIYMVQDFLQGGELFMVLQRTPGKCVSNDAAVFYGACMTESLSHLHKRNIIYRDLKLENVILDHMGYSVLIDLGFAKVVTGKTFTCCGSPEYMAPEVILGTGHGKAADHWSLGCVLYEMLVGQSPFMHKNATQMSLFRRIVKKGFAFPSLERHGRGVEPDGQDIILRLLHKHPLDRLGSVAGGEADIKEHAWFKKIMDRGRIVKRKIKAPWVPKLRDPLDASNFESFLEIEAQEQRHQTVKIPRDIEKKFKDF